MESDDDWIAPVADKPLHSIVTAPGSKSATNRLLLLGAQATGPTTLRGPLLARDTYLMIDALNNLGAEITILDDGDIVIAPVPQFSQEPGQHELALAPVDIDCGLAGTVMRFVPALAALTGRQVRFDGDEAARVRPMGPLLDALRALGVEVNTEDSDTLPFTITGGDDVVGGAVHVDAITSSQFVSAMLLIAPSLRHGLEVTASTELPSGPHVAMTVDALRAFGATVESWGADGDPSSSTPRRWKVAASPLAGGEITVEPDLSNAAVFLAAAAVTGGSVGVERWPAYTSQPGRRFPELLAEMGATVSRDGDTLWVHGPESHTLWGIDTDMSQVGELTPTLAAVCAVAQTPSRLRGVAHLRGHETDRLTALATEINRLGGSCHDTDDGLEIEPAILHGGTVESYHDHRMATFGAILGLRVAEVKVRNIATTAKTIPDFTDMWDAMVTG